MDVPKDDLKWFGEGFDGFPKRLPEDSVECTLFIANSKLSQKEVLSRLEAVKKEALSLTKSLLKEYIWQRDAFELKLMQTPDLIYLHGLTNYGDSVEDEWLIVYLLRELSKQFMDLWIKVIDTDGEFLLIEAANSLPRWLNPDIANNRVWINDSQLKIIPPTVSPSSATLVGPPRALAQPEALDIIRNAADKIEHFPQMEKEAFYRLSNYPAQINASLHRSLVTIPRKLAFILHELPSVIAPAVEAFYLRDPIGLKPLHSIDTSGLTFPPTDLVTVSVKFTKVLFAQLKSQQFDPPPAWKTVLNDAEKEAKSDAGKKKVEKLEMGMKVTSGFEMLISDGIRRDNRSVREMNILLEDISQGEALPADEEIKSWKDAQREDSEAWLDINFEDFEKELQGKNAKPADGAQPSQSSESVPASKPLTVDGKPAFGPEIPPTEQEPSLGFGDAKTQQDLKKMVERFESFLADDEAGPDGAELDDDDYDNDSDEDDENDEDEEDSEDDEDDDQQPMLDPKAFARMMREMMGVSTADLDDIPDFTGATAPPTSAARPLRGDGGNGKGKKARFEEVEDSDDEYTDGEEDEAEEFKKVMAAMDAELREAGALELDPKPKAEKPATLPGTNEKSADVKGKGKAQEKQEDLTKKQDWESESEEEMDIDFNLAKNLLESFKSQAGTAGPGGNLMGMMGMKLPRDEGEEEEARKQAGKTGPYYRGGPLQ